MFSSKTIGPLFSALFIRTCTVEGHTPCMPHTYTKKHTQSQPSCRQSDLKGHTQTVASLLCPLASLLLPSPPPPFHKTTQHSFELLRRKSKIYKRSTGDQWCCCILLNSTPLTEPEVRAWLPKPAGFFGAYVCPRARVFARMCLCSLNVCVGICMCAGPRVHETLPDNVTGKSQTVFVAN